ncbi:MULTISPECIES: 3-dehydroquinate synthase [Leuconostoc]|uniref:3-dehydroquinate synthase n=2 Tax=Leuconostoc kimchii TaxID=136609 RepID=D5T4M9_LEUKI|nr:MULTISPECIES: 3-dehydroquinate synthase [Leuconostoc]ADG41500.1 3-dehydroquinate synthase [Leuconostoc kimchii IMSNU 11154]QBR48453.1 3-dehydroquinate synthase [Leuconostoc kimchii]
MTTVHVSFDNKTYDVKINSQLHHRIGKEIADVWSPRKVALITDSHVGPLYLIDTQKQLEQAGFDVLPLQVPAGETSKSLVVAGELISQMAEAGFTRGDGLIALGGGVIGDLGGVVASLYMRGIAFIQIATSLTAQVDSSVGGKTAVNLGQTKNIAGTFYQPDLVLVDSSYLDTLTDRDLVEGYGEVVKTSALDSSDFFEFTGKIQSILDIRVNAQELSKRAIAYKAKIVMADEKEAGQRQYLNFGHTIGHAIELIARGELRHGEAVAIGMVAMTSRMARDGISKNELTVALKQRLEVVGLPTDSQLIGTPDFFERLINDKKNHGGVLNLVALESIGKPTLILKKVSDMPEFIG